jgi:hypothetical protein
MLPVPRNRLQRKQDRAPELVPLEVRGRNVGARLAPPRIPGSRRLNKPAREVPSHRPQLSGCATRFSHRSPPGLCGDRSQVGRVAQKLVPSKGTRVSVFIEVLEGFFLGSLLLEEGGFVAFDSDVGGCQQWTECFGQDPVVLQFI